MSETGTARQTDGAPKLADLMGAKLRETGTDVPPGSYGATLIGFGEPFMLAQAEKFRKAGQPDKRAVFEARFALVVGDQGIVELEYLVGVPDGGATNRRSNLFKLLKALGTGDKKLMKEDGTGFASSDVTLASFVGKTCVLSVSKAEGKDFPQVSAVGAPMAGVKCPTLEDARKALGTSDGLPF